MEKIYYLKNSHTDPRYNLALEEFLLTKREEAPIFFLWRNEPTVVIGSGQSAPDEVRLDIADRRGIHVVRRKTGGGAVYHDLGNVNFSFINDYGPASSVSLSEYVRPVLSALLAMGVDARFSGKNDIVVEAGSITGAEKLYKQHPGERAGNFKVCGTAYRIYGNRILSHGCILFDTNLTVLSELLTPDRGKLARHGVASAGQRVANLKSFIPQMPTEKFMTALFELVTGRADSAEKLHISDEDHACILSLMDNYPFIK